MDMSKQLGLVLLCSVFFGVRCADLDVEVFSNGSFSISLGGKQWFRSGSIGVRDLGQWWSQDEGSVEMTGSSKSNGIDRIGEFTAYQYEWRATGGASTLRFLTIVDVYEAVPAVVFSVTFLDKATNTNISDYVNLTLSTFPSFVIEDGPVERAYVTWSGNSKPFL